MGVFDPKYIFDLGKTFLAGDYEEEILTAVSDSAHQVLFRSEEFTYEKNASGARILKEMVVHTKDGEALVPGAIYTDSEGVSWKAGDGNRQRILGQTIGYSYRMERVHTGANSL